MASSTLPVGALGSPDLPEFPPSMCRHCCCIFDGFSWDLSDERSTSHRSGLLELRKSAADGCPLCAQFLDEISSKTDRDPDHGNAKCYFTTTEPRSPREGKPKLFYMIDLSIPDG